MKLTITSEPVANRAGAPKRSFTGEVRPDECAAMVAADYRMRQQQAEDPSAVQPRSAQEILIELGKDEYNAWHTLWRYDRNCDLLCSYNVWNEHGNQDLRTTPCVEDQLEALEREEQWRQVGKLLGALIDQLPQVQRTVVMAVLVEGRPATVVASERGVSKAAISKTLAKAKTALKHALQNAGVNYSGRFGLLLNDTDDDVQEGESR